MTDKPTDNEQTDNANLTDEEKKELVSAIANDIYKRANLLQVIQLVQTQCTNQAMQIVDNATPQEIEDFKKQLAGGEQPSEKSTEEEVKI